MDDSLQEALTSVPPFNQYDLKVLATERLGGLTNRNFLVQSPDGRFVLRLAGEGTEHYIDRKREQKNAQIAADAGVNAEIVHFDSSSGTMVTRFIENAITLDVDRFKDAAVLERTGRAFRYLHDSPEHFEGDFDLFEQIDQYLEVLTQLKAELPEGYATVQQSGEAVRNALSRHTLPSAPCHCDPMVENCIDDGNKVFVIDFEYAGNNDPMWDLGDLSVEGHFSAEQERILLSAYFGHHPDPFDVGRMIMYKAMCDLLWTLWGVVQHANQNPVDDFWAYAVERLQRCQMLMATEAFSAHLAAVENGPNA
ncbi:MAG: LPS biosynthesis choline kinase [Candidatus Thioglobus sp.]|nr:MAG: LPS biosynthesis choline kinase [Candidatus Thioglobus sp.]